MERVTTIPAHPRTPSALAWRRFRALVRRAPEAAAITAWIGLLALVAVWGQALKPGISLPTPPLLARVDPQASLSLLPAVAVAVALVLAGPRLAASLRWRSLLVGGFAATLAWVVALAMARGPDGLVGPVSWPSEYLAGVHFVATPGGFLAHFTDRIGAYNVHLRGHPPGMVLLLWTMREVGLGGEWPAAALMVGGGSLTVPAALIALREVADERRARAAAPYLVLLPAALWIGTSADALFAGVTAWAVALAILATRRRGLRSALLALGSGLLFGAGLMLSYGLALVGLVCLPVALARRRVDVLAIAAAAAGLVLAGFADRRLLVAGRIDRDPRPVPRRRRRPPPLRLLPAREPRRARSIARPRGDRRAGAAPRPAGLASGRGRGGGGGGGRAQRHVEGRGGADLASLRALAGSRRLHPAGPRALALAGRPGGGGACSRDGSGDEMVISRVLVTGGLGFVGSQVVDELVDRGLEVVALDSLNPRAHAEQPDYANSDADHVRADLRDPDAADRCLRGVDAVCHQASMVGLGLDFADAPDYVQHNSLGTANLLAAMARRRFRGPLVLASSMVIYGEGRYRCRVHGAMRPSPRDPRQLAAGRFEPSCPGCGGELEPLAVGEDSAPDPRNVYAASKLNQEHLCSVFARETGNPVTALRYHNVYGPRMPRDTPYAGVASIFRSSLEAGAAPRVFEDGAQRRDFVHVRDVAHANVLALTADPPPSGAFNIASGHPRSIGALAGALAIELRGPAPLVSGEYRLGDVRHVFAATEKAREELGFEARVGFGEGIAEFARAPLRSPVDRIQASQQAVEPGWMEAGLAKGPA